jgi:hypothetical protein
MLARILVFLCLLFSVAQVGFTQTFLPSLTVDNQNVARNREVRKIVSYTGGYYAVGMVGDDLLVQRYSATGMLIASALWDNPQGNSEAVRDAKMDTAGNLYVVCDALSNRQLSSWYLKFNASLAIQFERRLDRLIDAKLAVTPGGLGVLSFFDYANPTQFGVRTFAANGNLLWSASRAGTARCIALDLNNNVWVGGTAADNKPTLWRWNAISGLAITDLTIPNNSQPDRGFYAIGIDPNGTVYAAGTYEDLGSFTFLARFTNVFSTMTIEYPANRPATALRVDGTYVYVSTSDTPGNLYRITKSQFGNVNGVTKVSAPVGETFTDMEIEPSSDRVYALTPQRLIQYTKALTETTSHFLGDNLGSYDLARGPGGGSALIGGFAVGNNYSAQGRIVRINQNGTFGAGNDIGLFGRARHVFKDAHVDPAGELFACGLQGEGVDGLLGSFVHRVSAAGTLVWRAELPNFSPQAVFCDGTNVFVAGKTPTLSASLFTVMRLNRATGAVVWTRSIAGPGEGDPRDITVGQDGDPIVCGSLGGPPTAYRLLKESGDTVWTHKLGAPGTYSQVHATSTSAKVVLVATNYAFSHYAYFVNAGNGFLTNQVLLNRYTVKLYAAGETLMFLGWNPGETLTVNTYTLDATLLGSGAQPCDSGEFFGTIDASASRLLILLRNQGLYYAWQIGGGAPGIATVDSAAAVSFGPTGFVALGSENYTDAEGGTTTRMVLRRYNSIASLQEVQRINPPGAGLDTNPFTVLSAPSNRIFILGEMERRNQGATALYSRWRWN